MGGVLWSLLGIGVFVLSLWRFIRDVAPGEWTAARQAVFLALGALGAMRGLWNAQSNALAVGLLLLATASLVQRQWWTAAAVLAASVLIKLHSSSARSVALRHSTAAITGALSLVFSLSACFFHS